MNNCMVAERLLVSMVMERAQQHPACTNMLDASSDRRPHAVGGAEFRLRRNSGPLVRCAMRKSASHLRERSAF